MAILIPDYNGAYVQRVVDLSKLKLAGRKTFAMHTGGLVIECLLSSMVAKYFGVTNRTTNRRVWVVTKNTTSKHVKSDLVKCYITVPGNHLFREWIFLASDFIKIPGKIMADFDIVQYPLGQESFICLRYSAIVQISETDFSRWENSYNSVKSWLATNNVNI